MTKEGFGVDAGLSSGATQMICDMSQWQKELDGYFLIDYITSYVIYDGHKKLIAGDLEDFKSDLVWYFNSNSP